MSDAPADTMHLSSLLESGAAYTAPLDAAVEYLRLRIASILPVYVLAMAPHAVVIAMMIDAITAEQRSLIPRYCIYLCAATIWRWIGLTYIQQRVQRDLQLRPGRPLLRSLDSILLLRLFSNVAMSWGIFAVGIPVFYGLFFSGFATPLLLDDSAPAHGRLRSCITWIQHSARRLIRIAFATTVMTIWLLVVITVTQYFLIEFVLPHFFDIQLTEVQVTLHSWSWWLGIFYITFLILDMFWSVSIVMIYYDSQSHRLAPDLYARLAVLREGDA
jgi:hypothetical protein